MSELIDTTEMYLRTVFELEEEGIVPMRARIAERLHQSGPTVSQTVARMERDGLLTVADDRHIELSPKGRDLARKVMRKHRLAERLLTDVIGLDWNLVHDEACRWEHVISDAVEVRLVEILGDPVESPYGNPIPGDAEPSSAASFTPLSQLVGSTPTKFVLRRMSESVQADGDLLIELRDAGVVPGATIGAEQAVQGVLLEGALGTCLLPTELAAHLYVAEI